MEEEKETQDSYGKKLQKYCEVTSEIRRKRLIKQLLQLLRFRMLSELIINGSVLSEHSAMMPCFFADNVHFQNTAQLVAALTKAGVKYQVQVSGNVNYDNLYGGINLI